MRLKWVGRNVFTNSKANTSYDGGYDLKEACDLSVARASPLYCIPLAAWQRFSPGLKPLIFVGLFGAAKARPDTGRIHETHSWRLDW
jgi:hypothetical protein